MTIDVLGGDSALRVFAADGTSRATVPIPAVSTIDALAADPAGGDVIVGYENYITPQRWYHYDSGAQHARPDGDRRNVAG